MDSQAKNDKAEKNRFLVLPRAPLFHPTLEKLGSGDLHSPVSFGNKFSFLKKFRLFYGTAFNTLYTFSYMKRFCKVRFQVTVNTKPAIAALAFYTMFFQ